MKPVKGLSIDTRPSEQPDGTYPYGKNGIQYDQNLSVFNEPGFRKLAVVCPYKPIGVIETDSKPVILSTNNINSGIGFFDPELETYTPIVDDATWSLAPAKLGFSTDFYIRGQSQRNYKGELTITFTDKNKYPMFLNCDNPNLRSIDDLRLFAFFTPPTITVTSTQGGRLDAGAYYVAIGYEKNDGTSAPYSAVSQVAIVTPGSIAGVGDKALEITIDNADTNYDFMRVAIISKISGITKAVELTDYVPITGATVSVLYTGDNLSTDIDVTTVLTPPALYNKVGTIGQLNDYLYIANLQIEPDYNDMQTYANCVNIEWVSELMDATAPPPEHVSGQKRSRMHEEVYAIYIRYRKTRGGFTKWFTVPGNTPDSAALANSSATTAGGETNPIPVFKVEDTIPHFDPVNKRGATGFWQNSIERYPDTPDFDSTSIGGRNLRNQLVLHHKMPSLRWCKRNLYPTIDDYGRKQLDLLGIAATNIRIPDKYIGLINGYELAYAIRTVNNMTVLGQSTLMHGVTNYYEGGQATGNIPIYTSGGNYRCEITGGSFDSTANLATLRFDTMRLHPFDLLFNQPSITPNFISAQFKLRRERLRAEGYIEDADTSGASGSPSGPIVHLIDYTLGIKPNVISSSQLRKITSSFYLTNQVDANFYINSRHENCYAGYLAPLSPGVWDLSYGVSGIRQDHAFTYASQGSPDFEECFLVNLIAIKLDIYNNFYSQNLASAGLAKDLSDTSTFWAGDVFNNVYTFHTYGRHITDDAQGEGAKGIKCVRRFVCESVSNIALRYEIVGNQYSRWYPHTALVPNDPNNYITLFDRSQEPNQFGYTKDFNAINDLLNSTIYSPFREEVTKFPYRIHRGGKASRTGRPRSWRTFLPLDYYEAQKNMGDIMNLEGLDDRLIIHYQNGLFLTQDKAKLDGGVLKVTLGAGDIFQYEPQPAEDSKWGYGGTQHDLACVKTPFGYVFVDGKLGEIYLYKGKLRLLNQDINTFLRDWLKVKATNVFTGNGVTIGYDPRYKRILLTVKNTQVNGSTVKLFSDTDDFWNNLHVGDIINYNNRYIVYQGINTRTDFTCPPDPILHNYSWYPVLPVCLLDENGHNTGFKFYTQRQRYDNGVYDGYQEANDINGGLGTYFPPVKDTTLCPLPADVITWVGGDGECEKSKICGTGYTLSTDGSICTKENSMPATPPSGGGGTPGTVGKVNNTQWNNGGANVFEAGYPTSGAGTIAATLTVPHFWVNGGVPWAGDGGDPTTSNFYRNLVDSRMNDAGIWVAGHETDGLPTGEWIGFSRKVTVTTAKTVYVGMAADNMFKISINGVIVVDLTSSSGTLFGGPNFNFWNIYPVNLISGDNYIEMYAQNIGGPAGFAAEIYDNTYEDLLAATQASDLNIIFSTKNMVGQPFDLGETIGYSCPSGWSLDTTGGVYTCKQILTATPTDGPNTGNFKFTTRCKEINGVLSGYCEPNDNPATGQGTYVPPVPNDSCVNSPVGPTAYTLTATVELTCTDVNCTEQGETSLRITFSQPTPEALVILCGILEYLNNGDIMYVGNDIFTPPSGSRSDGFYSNTGTNVPFALSIPANTTQIIIGPNILQKNSVLGSNPWVCHRCLFPSKDLYFKIDSDSLNPNSLYTYSLNFSYINTSIPNQLKYVTVHNL